MKTPGEFSTCAECNPRIEHIRPIILHSNIPRHDAWDTCVEVYLVSYIHWIMGGE